jgi:hypothetical protein
VSSIFLAVQFEFTHAIGPHSGSYVVAHPASVDADGAALRSDDLGRRELLTGVTMAPGTADVLAITVRGAPAPRRKLRRRVREVEVDDAPAEVPLLLATFIRATEPIHVDEADGRLEMIAEDEEAQQRWVAEGLEALNRAIRGYRAGSRDPYVTEVAQRDARLVRIGYGTTEALPTGHFVRAAVLPPPIGAKPSREERLVPAETTADVLAGRIEVMESEDLLLRVYVDLDHGRTRAAALQLRAALGLLALELPEQPDTDGVKLDVDALIAEADGLVAQAGRGTLDGDHVQALEQVIGRVERAIELWRYSPKLEV